MPSNSPMWFCYECNAEMRPLMMPDPHCASCNGTFVEQIENDQDDPRNFQAGPLHGESDDAFGLPFGFVNTGPGTGSRSPPPNVPTNPLEMFQTLMMGLGGPQRPQRQSSTSSTASSNTTAPPPNGNANTFRIDRRSDNGNGGAPTFSFGPTSSRPGIMRGGSDIPYGAGSPPPPASSSAPGGAARTGSFPGGGFVLYSGSSGGGGPTHPGEGADLSPLLSALFGGPMSPNGDGGAAGGGAHGPPNPLQRLLMGLFGSAAGGGTHDGQFGDYAVTQEALDRIITQLMEQGNGDKPVPAPDDMIAKLPRAKVSEGSDLLEKDCAVCKDDFEIAQDTIQLPCKHVFHDECILPWIKQSGTCPVCRFELVPQPKHSPTATGPGAGGPSSGSGSGSGNAGGSSGGGGGLGGGLFSMFSRGGNHNNANSSSGTSQSSSSSPPGQGGLPGGWHDHDLD